MAKYTVVELMVPPNHSRPATPGFYKVVGPETLCPPTQAKTHPANQQHSSKRPEAAGHAAALIIRSLLTGQAIVKNSLFAGQKSWKTYVQPSSSWKLPSKLLVFILMIILRAFYRSNVLHSIFPIFLPAWWCYQIYNFLG
jgi:hypothetical protein